MKLRLVHISIEIFGMLKILTNHQKIVNIFSCQKIVPYGKGCLNAMYKFHPKSIIAKMYFISIANVYCTAQPGR